MTEPDHRITRDPYRHMLRAPADRRAGSSDQPRRALPRPAGPLDCGRRPSGRDRALAGLDFDAAEVTLLTAARHLFQSFAEPQDVPLSAAMDRATALYGPAGHRCDAASDGPLIVGRLLGALDTIRSARQSVFAFSTADCASCAAIVTEEECRLVRAVAALRRGDTGRALVDVLILCEGHKTEAVLSALDLLAIALPARPAASAGDGAVT